MKRTIPLWTPDPRLSGGGEDNVGAVQKQQIPDGSLFGVQDLLGN